MSKNKYFTKHHLNLLLILHLTVFAPYSQAGWLSIFTKSDDAARAVRTLLRSKKLAKHAVKSDEIIEFVEISSKPGGAKIVGQMLGKRNLPPEILEDTYFRLLIAQKHLSRDEAAMMFKKLGGTPGLRTTLRKISGANPANSLGHLTELQIANHASQRGHDVIEIGRKFNDGRKLADTDIDVLLRIRNKRTFACEVKNYTGDVPFDTILKDTETLIEYAKRNPGVDPVFIFTRPPSPAKIKLLRSKGVTPLVGEPAEVIPLLELL